MNAVEDLYIVVVEADESAVHSVCDCFAVREGGEMVWA
jgi:hypothetical protein